ncbi:MAG: sulfatase-like hydrolase/transferase, partial [Verrucomicrobiaceae bacterium]|nr:sulfatase-like hydrolase/transferase [Verrucomicrobiaceae bacterium]
MPRRLLFIVFAFQLTISLLHAASKPNILILLADDLGYADIGCHGCKDIPTPHIDSIAKNGTRFTDAYVTVPHCVQSRASILTGRYAQRGGLVAGLGMGAGTANGLSTDEKTLAERLRPAGYRSMALGKWHLGEAEKYRPINRGFDEFYGFLAGMHDYFKDEDPQWGPIFEGAQPGKLDGYLTDVLAGRAADFIRRGQKQNTPWFMYLAFNAVHTPLHAKEAKLQQFAGITDPTRRSHAAMVSSLDDAVGQVLAAVRDAGAEERTLIFFLSDNGGPLPGHAGANGALNTPLRGSKLEVWEGGVRVPMLAQWKGRIPEGHVVEGMVSSMDIAATALSAAGADVKKDKRLDGFDLLPLLDGKADVQRHKALFFEFGTQQAARVGNWKWVSIPAKKPVKGTKAKNGENEAEQASTGGLIYLHQDVAEARDVSAEQPERVKQMRAAFDRWKEGAKAEAAKPAAFRQLDLNTACVPTRKIAYKKTKDGGELLLHVFEPPGHAAGAGRAAYVVFHGGGWTGFEPQRFYAFADYHARNDDMVGISVQYRLADRPMKDGKGIERCVWDARSALRYIRSHAHELGIDPTRLAVAGGSAGGHLAAATAILDGIDEPGEDTSVSCRPDALLLYFPAIDLSEHGIATTHRQIGADWQRLSPLHHMRDGLPPTLIFQGDADIVTPPAGASAYQKAMREHGGVCELISYAGGKHGYYLGNREQYDDTLTKSSAFLRKHALLPLTSIKNAMPPKAAPTSEAPAPHKPSASSPGPWQTPFYQPQNPDPPTQIWGGQWIWHHDGTWYWIYDSLRHPGVPLHLLTSKDGVYWREEGAFFGSTEDYPKSQPFNPEVYRLDDGRWVLAYSIWGSGQDGFRLRYAVSTDCRHWQKLGAQSELKPPAADWYENNLLCCPVSARHPEGGWFHLIYTKPKNAVGMGFARSKEGLAPVLQAPVLTHGVPCNFYDDHPDYAKGLELGGITRLGDRWFMIGGSRQGDIIVSATKPEGPYSPTPLNHSLPRGPEVFPRIYNDVPDGPLVTHTLKTTGQGGARYTTEPLKKLVREGSSVWLKWWPGNEKLKSSPVDLIIQDGHFTLPADPESCIVLEAQVALDGIAPETNWARTAKVSATQEYRFGPPAIGAEHYLGAEHVIDGRNERGWMGDYLGVHHHMRLGKEAFLAALQKRDQPSVLNLDLGQVRPIGRIVATW